MKELGKLIALTQGACAIPAAEIDGIVTKPDILLPYLRLALRKGDKNVAEQLDIVGIPLPQPSDESDAVAIWQGYRSNEDVSGYIASVRKHYRLSAAKFARECGVGRSTLISIEAHHSARQDSIDAIMCGIERLHLRDDIISALSYLSESVALSALLQDRWSDEWYDVVAVTNLGVATITGEHIDYSEIDTDDLAFIVDELMVGGWLPDDVDPLAEYRKDDMSYEI